MSPAVIIDLDQTLVPFHTAKPWLAQEVAAGRVTTARAMAAYTTEPTIPAALRRLARSYAGMTEAEWWTIGRSFVERLVMPRVRREAWRVIESARSRGWPVALATAQLEYVALPVAQGLGVSVAACTRMETRDGALTGSPSCIAYGEGKLREVQLWCDRSGVRLLDSTVYTDSVSDVPLLRSCGRPVAVNPDRALRREAGRRSWEIVRW